MDITVECLVFRTSWLQI